MPTGNLRTTDREEQSTEQVNREEKREETASSFEERAKETAKDLLDLDEDSEDVTQEDFFFSPVTVAEEGLMDVQSQVDEAARKKQEREDEFDIQKQESARDKFQAEQTAEAQEAFLRSLGAGRTGFQTSGGFGASQFATRAQLQRDTAVERNRNRIASFEADQKELQRKIELAERQGKRSTIVKLQTQLDQIATDRAEAEKDLLEAEKQYQLEGLKNLETILGFDTDVLASFTGEEISNFTGIGIGQAEGFIKAADELKTARDELAKDPTNVEKQNKVFALEGKVDKIKNEATESTEIEKEIRGLERLRDNGIITEDQFNKALKDQIGVEREKQFKTVDGKAFIFDTTTGKTTRVNTKDKKPVAPFIADIGTGNITQNYGTDVSAFNPVDHVPLQKGGKGTPGLDIDGVTGDPIQAFVGGTVTQVAQNGGYGNQVIVTDEAGNQHMYSHLRELPAFLVPGETKISAGDVLGFMGNSGTVFDLQGNKVNTAVDKQTGAHLDYRVKSSEVKNGSRWADPNNFIAKEEGYDPALIPLYAKFTQDGKLTSTDKDLLDDAGVSFEDFKDQALAAKQETDKSGATFAQEIITIAEKLKTQPGRTGAAFGIDIIPFTNSRDFQRTFDSFKSKLSLQNLTDLKANGATFGALSNQELQFITNAATALDEGMSDEEYFSELDKIIEQMRKVSEEITGEDYAEVLDKQLSNPTLEYLNDIGAAL